MSNKKGIEKHCGFFERKMKKRIHTYRTISSNSYYSNNNFNGNPIVRSRKMRILKDKKFITVIGIIICALIVLLSTGCTSAETVSYNLSREADEFKVKRRIVFVNLRTNDYLLEITGNCSTQGGISSFNRELEVICRIGEDKYQKHFLYIADETAYTVEQLEYNDVSRYDYEIVFRPEAIIPITIKTQAGD